MLVRGDLSMAGTCTVTYVDATHLLACGHPITQFGQVSMPMTKADVVATLASPLNAFKIINTTETVGAFTEDRASAIMGRFGKQARMIPVTVEVKDAPQAGANAKSEHRTVHFEVLDNRSLTPSTMLVSVYQSLQQANGASAEMSYRMSGKLTVQGLPTVKLEGIMAPNGPNSAAIDTALYINDRFGDIYANEDEQPIVTGMQLKMEVMPDRHTAVLEQARLSQTEVHAGGHGHGGGNGASVPIWDRGGACAGNNSSRHDAGRASPGSERWQYGRPDDTADPVESGCGTACNQPAGHDRADESHARKRQDLRNFARP